MAVKERNINYFLFISMAAYSDFWNIDFNLIPTEKEFNGFINNEIFPNISIMNELLN